MVAILYEPEIVVFLRDAHKLGLNTPKYGALGADFINTEKRLGAREPMIGFYQAFQFKDLIDGPGMKKARDIIEPRLTGGREADGFFVLRRRAARLRSCMCSRRSDAISRARSSSRRWTSSRISTPASSQAR